RTDAGHDLALGQMPMAHQPRQSAVSLSAWPPRKPAISASTACANSARAPLRKISVNGSLKVPGCASLITLSWVTAYHSFGGEVEAFEHPTIRRLTPSSRHQLSRIALLGWPHTACHLFLPISQKRCVRHEEPTDAEGS